MTELSLNEDQKKLLQILKGDSRGCTRRKLLKQFGPGFLRCFKELVELGVARFDRGKNGRPDRFKPLKKAWDV